MLPSGVGTQTKYVIEALLQSGKFEVISLAGAISHNNYQPIITNEYGEDWRLFPIDGYGNKDKIRSFLRQFKPDILYFMTDPRFYDWLWSMEDEIRQSVPMVYYHVWDNKPYPFYNKVWYESNDYIAAISKVTSDIVQTVAPGVEEKYIPHAVDGDVFKRYTDSDSLTRIKELRQTINCSDKTVFFWNNRNARRKQSGSLLFWYKEFLDKVGHDQACLILHTDIDDPHGQPLNVLADHLGLNKGQIVFSTEKLEPYKLALCYNAADATLNISDAEGFGLGTLESLSCETPIIVNMTGGLQEQVTDGENWFGIGIEPSSKAVIGSQSVPWIYEDRISQEDFVNALVTMHEMSKEERHALGKMGREHVDKNYNFENFKKTWVEFMLDINKNSGSWNTRKNYNSWKMRTI
jgi:glycosyltransferase involved in cell wall biosynthesis